MAASRLRSYSRWTIFDWAKHYAKLLKKFERKLRPKVKWQIHIDDVVLEVGKRKCYSTNAVDGETKYNLESMFVKSRSLEAFMLFFGRLKEKIKGFVKAVYRREKSKPREE